MSFFIISWTIVTGTMTLVSGTLYLRERFKYVSARPKWLQFRKSDIGKDIELLVKKLGQIGNWMDNSEETGPLRDEIRHDILGIEWKVWKETYSHFALRLGDEEHIKLALRNLSQVQGKTAIERALKSIEEKRHDIVRPPSKEVKKLIDAVQKELEEMLQLEKAGNLKG